MDTLDIYKIEIANKIKENWAFSARLAGGDAELVVLFTIRVMPNGGISDVSITQSSGNGYFDESALNAVKKANPVKPHPNELNLPYLDLEIEGRSSELM